MTLVTHHHLPELATPAAVEDDIWAKSDNVLQQYGAFSEDRLVAMPSVLDFQQASMVLVAAWTACGAFLDWIPVSWDLDTLF